MISQNSKGKIGVLSVKNKRQQWEEINFSLSFSSSQRKILKKIFGENYFRNFLY